MKSRSRGGRRPSIVLIGLCLILGGVIYLELSFGPSHPAASPIAPGGPPARAVSGVWSPRVTMTQLEGC